MKFYTVYNRANMKGVRTTDDKCPRCGAVSSAYLSICTNNVPELVLCKGCLLDGVDMIDKELLEQSKTRVS